MESSIKNGTDSEKERVLESLSDLPSELLMESVTGIYRMAKSKSFGINPASNYQNQIALYDSAFEKKENLSRVLGHEFSHVFYRQTSDAEKLSYAKSAEWEANFWGGLKDVEFVPRQAGFVEEDGKNSIEEDFCNNIEYFIFNPKVLKEKTPKVYDWISKKYGDKFKRGKW